MLSFSLHIAFVHVIVHYPPPPFSNLSEIFGTNNLIMCHTCKGSNNQPKDSDELCATDGESAELGAILSQIRLAQSSLHFYATLYIYSLYIHLCALSTSLHVYFLYIYMHFTYVLYVLFIIYLLHLYSIHIYMLSTFYAPLHLYALYIYMVP